MLFLVPISGWVNLRAQDNFIFLIRTAEGKAYTENQYICIENMSEMLLCKILTYLICYTIFITNSYYTIVNNFLSYLQLRNYFNSPLQTWSPFYLEVFFFSHPSLVVQALLLLLPVHGEAFITHG